VARIVVRKTAGELWRGRRPELVAQSEIERELRRDLPFVLHIGKKRRLADRGKQNRQIADEETGLIEQESGKGVRGAGFRIAVQSRGAGAKRPLAARVEDACLEIVAQAPDIHAPLDGVVADDAGPVAYEVEIGFGALPGLIGGETDHRARVAVDVDGGQAARGIIEVYARDAEVLRGS